MKKYEGKPLVVDIEGQGNPQVVHPSAVDVLCVGLHHGDDTIIVTRDLIGGVGEFPEMWEALAKALIIGQNIKYDAVVLGHWLTGEHKPLPCHRDTMMQFHTLWPGTKHKDLSLHMICKRLYGADDWSLPDYSDMHQYNETDLHTYCAMDVQYEWMVYRDLEAAIQQTPERLYTMQNIIMPFVNLAAWAEWYGVNFDYEYVSQELIPEMRRELESHLIDLRQLADRHTPEKGWPKKKDPVASRPNKPVYRQDFNPASYKQVKQVLTGCGYGLKSTDEKTLKPLVDKGDEFATKLVEYRGVAKNLGTYAEAALKRNEEARHPFGDHRIFPTYNLFGTLTGRLSSSGPNIQNQPKTKQMRRMYTASGPGRVLMQADYSQAELRVMAALAEDEWLLGIFADPTMDIFDSMMPEAFPNEEFVKDSPRGAKMRSRLKRTIYGLSYGRGAAAIAYELNMPVREAQAIMDNFLAAAADYAEWRKRVLKDLHSGRGLTTRFGRYFQQDVITPANKASVERSALSFLPQSSASDCCLLSAIRLKEWIFENGKDWRFMALVHDSINLDVPEEEAQQASNVTRDFLCQTAAEFFPEVAWKAAGNWGWSWDETD